MVHQSQASGSRSITLTELISMLQEGGITVMLPHEQMMREAAHEGEAQPSPPPVEETPAAEETHVVVETETVVEMASVVEEDSAPVVPPPASDVETFAALVQALAAMGVDTDTLCLPAAAQSASGSVGGSGGVAMASTSAASGSASAVDKGKSPLEPPADKTLTGFVCVNCKSHNLLRPAKESWYVITAGRQVGVFQGWEVVQPLVIGVSGACFKKHPSQADALQAFAAAINVGTVVVLH